MNIPEPMAWRLPSKAAFDKLLRNLAEHFPYRHKPGKVQRVAVLDNFDWDLWHGATSLISAADGDYLLSTSSREFNLTAVRKPARFWWDFAESDGQALLKKISPLRALLPVATIRYAVHCYELLNADDKIVVRVKLIQHYSAESQQSRKVVGVHLQVMPLMGYDEEFQEALSIIAQAGFKEASLPDARELCLAQDVMVNDKPGKTFAINAAMPAEQAVRLMGGKMVAAALAQRAGLLDDIDTEFLHQYRVQLRKARSLLSLLKRSLAPDVEARLKSLLAKVFSPTNRLRDLDVFLLERHRYQSLLPAEYSEGLASLFQQITRERHSCQKNLVRTLTSRTYQRDIARLESIFHTEPDFQGEEAQRAIGELAQKRITSRYRKIRKIGNNIDGNTPDSDIHQLRKECKKLRYLMEFFAELFPKKAMAKLVKHLKGLQDILGEFNDYSVQQEFLHEVAKREKSKAVLAAVNGLIAILHQKQMMARAHVQEAFAAFSNDETTAAFNALALRS